MMSLIDPGNFQTPRRPEQIVAEIRAYPLGKPPSDPVPEHAEDLYPFDDRLADLLSDFVIFGKNKPGAPAVWAKVWEKAEEFREFARKLNDKFVSRDALILVELMAQMLDAEAAQYKQAFTPEVSLVYDLDKLVDVRAQLRDEDVECYIGLKKEATNLRRGIKPLLRELAAARYITLDESQEAAR